MSLQDALTAFILVTALIYSTKYVRTLIGFLGGKVGGGGSALGGYLTGKGITSGIRSVKSSAKKAGGFTLDKANKLGGIGLDKVRDKLDDAGFLDKGEEKSGGIGSALKNMGKDAIGHHGANVADAGKQFAHQLASKAPGTNKAKHDGLANMYANKRQEHVGFQQGLRNVGDVEKVKTQYDNDSVAHNLSQHRLDSLLSHSPEARQLKNAQADVDAFKATDTEALEKQEKMEHAKIALQDAKREQYENGGAATPEDKEHMQKLQNDFNLAKSNYDHHLDSSDQVKNLKQAQQKYDAFVHTSPQVKDARNAVERTGFRVAQSKDAYMENKHKFDDLSLQKKMLPQTYDVHKELVKSLSKGAS